MRASTRVLAGSLTVLIGCDGRQRALSVCLSSLFSFSSFLSLPLDAQRICLADEMSRCLRRYADEHVVPVDEDLGLTGIDHLELSHVGVTKERPVSEGRALGGIPQVNVGDVGQGRFC